MVNSLDLKLRVSTTKGGIWWRKLQTDSSNKLTWKRGLVKVQCFHGFLGRGDGISIWKEGRRVEFFSGVAIIKMQQELANQTNLYILFIMKIFRFYIFQVLFCMKTGLVFLFCSS